MKEAFRAQKISENVWWVGAVDWNIRDFHGYRTGRGTTYNAYLVKGEEYVLIDTVKHPFLSQMMGRIESVVEPDRIRYMVSNHSEMDHTGSLPHVLKMIQPEKLFASKMGAKALKKHFGSWINAQTVKDTETVKLGGLDFTFLETRMLHWPDSMVSYLPSDRLLFSQDGFGMHLAGNERFADQVADDVLRTEGARYFANILLPYADLILKLLARMEELALPIDILAPDHGPVWRKDIGTMPGLYAQWAAQKPTMKAVIVYDSMWHSTELMAAAVSEGLAEAGAKAIVMSLESCHRSDVVTHLLDAGALIAGSSTLNNNMLPRMADMLTYIRGLKPKNLIGCAFGSYGWSGESPKQIHSMLLETGIEPVQDPVRVQYVPDDEELLKCRDMGALVGNRLREITGKGE